jgi:bifunctional lysine-specific demethylase and histidyl-hydroxylase NO66
MASSEPWLDDPLGYLIGPERVADFFARYYEREALIVTHNAPQRFDGLLSIDEVDRMVTNLDLREGQLDLADAAHPIVKADFVDAAGFVDRGAVALKHRAGATIILQQAHQYEAPLARFCRGLEHVFSAHVQTNLYLTPPNAQGFRTHYDNHDVLVAQIEGEKAWRLYDKPVDTPYRGERFQSAKHAAGERRAEFTLRAGDCAYVPRGLMHDASVSGDAPSLHVTIGLITRTWADLMLEAVSEVALRTPDFRKSLPPGFARPDFDREAARAYVKRLAETAAREVVLDPALELMIDAFIRSRAADNRGAVRDANQPITAADRFRARRHAPFRIADDGDGIALIASGGEIAFPPEARPILERALSGEEFSAAEFGDKAEAWISKLLAYGLVVRL